MTRRSALLASLIAALTPQRLRAASNVSSTCPPPFVRNDDPVRLAFINDLHDWAYVNRHVARAHVYVNPALKPFISDLGYHEFATDFVVTWMEMPYPWVLTGDCSGEPT